MMGAVVNFKNWRDSFSNLLAGLGVVGRDKFMSQQYTFLPMSLSECEMAYRGDWIARKCVDIPAFDMTRQWRAWQADQDQITALEKCEREVFLQQRVQQALIKARLYGGAIMVIGVEAGNPEEPLDPETVTPGALKFLHVVPWQHLSMGPTVWDVTSLYWGQPSWYQLNTTPAMLNRATGGVSIQAPMLQVKLHPSRVVRFVGMPVPDPLTSTTMSFGDSVLQAVNDAIKACGLVAGSLATLISEMKVDVIKVPNLSEELSTDTGTQKIISRFSNANVAKSVINTILLDSNEEWQRVTASLTGAEQLLSTYLQIASGAVDIPAGRFLGLPHRGLNVTGEADFRNYYDRLASEQTVMLTPAMTILDEVLMRSALGDRPDDVGYNWNSLWQMTDKEKADLAFAKAQTYKIDADEGQIPATALANARVNQLIEDGFYPGLEQALEDAAAEGDTIEEQNAPAPPPQLGDPSAQPLPGTPLSGQPQPGQPQPGAPKANGGAQDAKKATHAEANYRPGEGDQRCKNCTMFQPPRACTDVLSPIRAQDVCDYFKMKTGDADWDEGKHPRDPDGKFGEGGGGETGTLYSKHEYGEKTQIIAKQGKKEVGEISMVGRPDGHLEVSNVLVWPEFQHSGEATQLYKQAYEHARSQGKELHVSGDRTPDALKLHAYFERKGILRGSQIVFR